MILVVYLIHSNFQAAVLSLSMVLRCEAATSQTFQFLSSGSILRCQKPSQSRVFNLRQRAISSQRGYLGYSLSQSFFPIFNQMFSSSHSIFQMRIEYQFSLLLITLLMKSTNQKNTPFILSVSSCILLLSLTSGSEHRISGNFIMLLKWHQYLVLLFSASPVSDLMKSRLRAVWMQLFWFQSHNFQRYSSMRSLMMLVLRTIYFDLVFGEVKHSFIYVLAKNCQSLRFFISPQESLYLTFCLWFWKLRLEMAFKQHYFDVSQIPLKQSNLFMAYSSISFIKWPILTPRLKTCRYSIFSFRGIWSMEFRVSLSSRMSSENMKSSMALDVQNYSQDSRSGRLRRTCLTTFFNLLPLKAFLYTLAQSTERLGGRARSVKRAQDLLALKSLPVILSLLSPKILAPQLIISILLTLLIILPLRGDNYFYAPLISSNSFLISVILMHTQQLLMALIPLFQCCLSERSPQTYSHRASILLLSMFITQWMQLAMLTFRLVTRR